MQRSTTNAFEDKNWAKSDVLICLLFQQKFMNTYKSQNFDLKKQIFSEISRFFQIDWFKFSNSDFPCCAPAQAT